MLKRILHAANQAVTHPETYTGTELEMSGTVNDAVDNLKVYGQSEQASTTGAQLIDMDKWQLRNCVLLDRDAMTFKANIKGAYFSSLETMDEDILKFVLSKKGQYLSLIIDDCISKEIAIVVYGTFSFADRQSSEISRVENRVSFLVPNDMQTITKFELRFGRVREKYTDTDTVYSGLMLCDGADNIPYEPYTGAQPSPNPGYPQGIVSVDNPVLESHGKNLLATDVSDCNNWHTHLPDGSPVSYAYIPVTGLVVGETYTVAVDSVPDIGEPFYFCVGDYGGNGNIGTQYWVYHTKATSLCNPTVNFTARQDTYYINCNSLFNQGRVDEFVRLFPNLRIYKGAYTAEAVPFYERYRGNTITLPITLRSLPDGTRDCLVVDRAAKRCWVERNVRELILTGGENYRNNWYPEIVLDINPWCHYKSPLPCNYGLELRTGNTGSSTLVFAKADTYWGWSSADDAKAWIKAKYNAGNPMIIHYALANPTTEEIPWSDDYLVLTNQYYTRIHTDSELSTELEVTCKILGSR